MSKNNTGSTRLLVFSLLASLVVLYIGCNSSSSSGGTENTTPEETADASGTWQIHEEISRADCNQEDPDDTDDYSLTVTQSGDAITVTDQYGRRFTGTVSGNTLSWTGEFDDDGGTVTITSMSLTISGNTINGTASWTWSDGNETCSGTTRISGTRTSGGGSPTGGWAGSWTITETETINTCGDLEKETFTITITVNGNQITLTLPDGSEPVTGTISGKTATLSQILDDGGGTQTTNVTLTLSDDGLSLTGSVSWSEDFPGDDDDCSGTSELTGIKQ